MQSTRFIQISPRLHTLEIVCVFLVLCNFVTSPISDIIIVIINAKITIYQSYSCGMLEKAWKMIAHKYTSEHVNGFKNFEKQFSNIPAKP